MIRTFAVLAGVLCLTGAVAAAVIPVHFESEEELFEIPKGTWARRMAGDNVDVLPNQIYLVVSDRGVLRLRNLDDVPQVFGPTVLMPGQSLRLRFSVASDYQFACTAHTSGELTVRVFDSLSGPADRLLWRGLALTSRIRLWWGRL